MSNNKDTTSKEIIRATPIRSDYSVIISDIHKFPEFIKFAEWFSTPKQIRKIKNQKEFAVVVGVCEDTLTDWKRHPQFWPLVQQHMVQWMKEAVPDVIYGLYKNASGEGKAKDVEMFLRLSSIEINK